MIKNITKRTGRRISDFEKHNIKTFRDLRDLLMKKPTPKKLSTELGLSKAFAGLPNVSIEKKRVTMVDREKAIGRWQLIEEKLNEKGLSVNGTNTNVRKSFTMK